MKKLELKYFILFALVLILLVECFVIGSLFATHTNLEGWKAVFGSIFIGCAFSISIFICIMAGSEIAGICFSFCFLVLAILYNDSWDYFLIDFKHLSDPVHISYHKKFYATTMFSLLGTILNFFLTKQYVKLSRRSKLVKSINTLQHMEFEAREDCELWEQKLTQLKKEVTEINTLIETKEDLEQEILSLKKRKARASTGLTEAN